MVDEKRSWGVDWPSGERMIPVEASRSPWWKLRPRARGIVSRLLFHQMVRPAIGSPPFVHGAKISIDSPTEIGGEFAVGNGNRLLHSSPV